MVKINLKNTDVCLVITEEGESTVYMPNKKDISWQSIHAMLKEIRKLETIFTGLVNETYAGENNKQNQKEVLKNE